MESTQITKKAKIEQPLNTTLNVQGAASNAITATPPYCKNGKYKRRKL